MKLIHWTDFNGYLRCSMLRDEDDERFPERGVPVEPPPVQEMIEEAAKDLHNELMQRGLVTMRDIENSGNALTGAILSVFRTRLITLYKLRERKQDG
jgi:hypothetical protein